MAKKIIMCPADYFDVTYEINAWMHRDNRVNYAAAKRQWRQLHDTYAKRLGWEVLLIPPAEHLPDMVFSADYGLVVGEKILLANFRYPERQPEADHLAVFAQRHGYTHIEQAVNKFEGGDNLVCGDKILAGWGFRSDPQAADELHAYFGLDVVPLRLVNPLFYHLDTCVAVLSADTVACYLPALDKPSQQRLRSAVPNIIEATVQEAESFGLNAVSDGKTVIASNASPTLLKKYKDAGFAVIGTPITEFRKSGGGAKCMTLYL